MNFRSIQYPTEPPASVDNRQKRCVCAKPHCRAQCWSEYLL